MEIINKIFSLYKNLYLFGADKGFRFAFWLKKVLSKFDLFCNIIMDFVTIGINLFFIYLWFKLFSNNLALLFMLILIHLHTIIVFVLVCRDRFMYIKKTD